MDRRVALVALWAAFAAAAVGVGFGAAGLVGDPFSGGVTNVGPAVGVGRARTAPVAVPSPSKSTTSTPSRTSDTSSARPTGGASGTGPTGRVTPPRAVTRTITTRGGLVSATCRGGLVQVGASPAVGWRIEDIDGGARAEARVRFEPSEDDRDGRVEVEAACSQGTPWFSVDDDRDGH